MCAHGLKRAMMLAISQWIHAFACKMLIIIEIF